MDEARYGAEVMRIIEERDRLKQELQCALERELRLTRERESVENERERCARIADELGMYTPMRNPSTEDLAWKRAAHAIAKMIRGTDDLGGKKK